MLRLRVVYHRAADLVADEVAQFRKGGLLVRVAPPAELALFDQVELELVCGRSEVVITAQVVQTAQDSLAVMFDQKALQAFVAGASDDGEDADAEHSRVVPGAEPAARAATSPGAPVPHGPQLAKRIQQALHGNKDERAAIMRDVNKQLHPFVLKNPQLDADDVVTIAKNAQVTPELLTQIGERKEWFQRPAIALALAKNPRTPPALAVRALDHVGLEALRQIAKGTGTLPHVTQAARKKLLG